MKKLFISLAVLSALVLSGCGEDGKPGKIGSVALTVVSDEAAGENCEFGGKRVDTGFDADRDGALSEEEIQATEYICDGEDGTDGTNGTDGVDGEDGKDGTNGTDGVDGVDGKDGEPGLDGEDGTDGKDGEPGLDGENGTDGKDGEPGLDGENGIDGKDGEPGIDGEPGADGVCAGNNAPSIDAIEVNGNLYDAPLLVKVDQEIPVVVIASDIDGDALSYSLTGSFALINDNGSGSFAAIPKAEKTIYFSVVVSDGCQIVVKNISLRAVPFLKGTFTNCTQTGKNGPSQGQCDTEYTGTELEGKVTVTAGIQEWTVPYDGTYKIEAYGAQGGNSGPKNGGLGAKISGEFNLIKGEVIKILAGQHGTDGIGTEEQAGGTGGGGSFVVKSPYNTNESILVIAGGGGGAANHIESEIEYAVCDGGAGQTSQNGQNGGVNGGAGGIDGNGGTTWSWDGWHPGSGGGGFFTDGVNNTGGWNGTASTPGYAFVNNGLGAQGGTECRNGGFGGGGAAGFTGGGGGGYSGGGSADFDNSPVHSGGGGGSYNSGADQENTAGASAGHGKVVIELL